MHGIFEAYFKKCPRESQKNTVKHFILRNSNLIKYIAGITLCHWKQLSKASQFTPKDQWKCQTHKNLLRKFEACFSRNLFSHRKQYDCLFWDEIICNTSENSACWLNKCNT